MSQDDNTNDKGEIEVTTIKYSNKPTNLGYLFGEIDDGLLILESEYKTGMVRAQKKGFKEVYENKELEKQFKKIFDMNKKDMDPVVKTLVDGEILEDQFLIERLTKIHSLLKGLQKFDKAISLMPDIKNTVATMMNQYNHRMAIHNARKDL
jgi:hypothetical protein